MESQQQIKIYEESEVCDINEINYEELDIKPFSMDEQKDYNE